MSETRPFLIFGVGEETYALDVAAVERVLPAAEVTPLPDAPATVLGLINIAGELMPVISARRHFSLPSRDMELSDRLIALTEDCLRHGVRPSVTDWEEPIAVGGPDWIRHLAQTLPESWRQIRPFQTPSLPAVPTAGLQAIHVSRNRARPCVYSLLRRHAAHPPA